MNLIAAVDLDWGIGKEGNIPWHIPGDMKFFRDMTLGNVVIMGRKTLESLPGGRPLKGRTNIILTQNFNYRVDGGIVVHSTEEVLEHIRDYPSDKVFVIGGGTIYQQMMPFCDTAYITKVTGKFGADTYFPNLDILSGWELVSQKGQDGDPPYQFTCYKKGGA